MSQADERRCHPTSVPELERRWAAVRKQMPAAGIDALIIQGMNNANGTGGYYRWFTGISVYSSYPQTVIVPREGLMTVVWHGAFNEETALDGKNPEWPGIGLRLGAPAFPGVNYCSAYEAELTAKEVQKRGYRSIGVVAPQNMLFGFGWKLRELLRDITFVDATDLIDPIKAIKSPEEIAFIRQTAVMQDEIIAKVKTHLRPGRRDFEVMAHAQYVGQLMGSETGYFLGCSAPPGQPAGMRRRSDQNRMIREGDLFMFQAENTGPGGLFVHHGRVFSLGKPAQEVVDLFGQMVEAQDYTIGLLKPGASCREIFAEYNAYMRSRGLPEEKRLHCHGQGYDVVERPLIRNDESMTIEANMNIGIHPSPGLSNPRVFVTVCDNFLIGADGAVERLHTTPRTLIEL
ncbi:MAG: M24 family metallopeptidase [Rhodoplanes sp.]